MELEKCKTVDDVELYATSKYYKPREAILIAQRAYTLGMLKGAELMQEAAINQCWDDKEANLWYECQASIRVLSPADVIKPQGKTDM